jgi:hypothetical protein
LHLCSTFVSPDIFSLPSTAPATVHGKSPETRFHTNAHLLVEFGLGLFVALLKRTKVDKADADLAAMLAPFAALLTDCLHSKYNRVMELGLKSLTQLLRAKTAVAAVQPLLDHIVTRVFKLVRRLGVFFCVCLASPAVLPVPCHAAAW